MKLQYAYTMCILKTAKNNFFMKIVLSCFVENYDINLIIFQISIYWCDLLGSAMKLTVKIIQVCIYYVNNLSFTYILLINKTFRTNLKRATKDRIARCILG